MGTTETRRLVTAFNEARADNDVDAIRAILGADVEWYPPASIRARAIRGRDRVTAALTGGSTGAVLDPDSIERTIVDVVVDGETAVVRQSMTATRLDGAEYRNDYCWVYTFHDGQLTRLIEYGDTLLIARAGFVPLEAPTTASKGR